MCRSYFVDISFDPVNSPPIVSNIHTDLNNVYGFLANGGQAYYYGIWNGGYYLANTSIWLNTRTAPGLELKHHVGSAQWVGSRFWIVGGYSPSGKRKLFVIPKFVFLYNKDYFKSYDFHISNPPKVSIESVRFEPIVH